jgi:tetratricopeptide (TPR) repeat protein
VAVNLAALAAVAGEPEDRLREFARQWHERALAHPVRCAQQACPAAQGAQDGAQEGAQEGAQDGAAPELWAVCGHLRPWLLAPERISPDERRAAHRAAGDFLRDLEARDGEGELGLSWLGCLLEARAQYLAAGGFEPALAVTDRISVALLRRGEYGAVERLNSDLLGHAEHAAPMSWIGRAHLERGDSDDARRWYERCLDLARGRLPREEAVAWHGLATIDFRQRDLVGAEAKLVKLLELEQRAGNRAGEAAAWHQLAVIDGLQKRASASRRKFQKSLDVARDAGDRAGEAAAHCALAEIDVKRGDLAGAREKFERALALVRETGNRAGEVAALHNLAGIDLDQGDWAAAHEKFQASLAITRETGDRAGEALTWAQAGITVGKRGRHEDGLRLLLLAAMQLESIGHADLRRALTWINGIVLHLKWAQAQLDALAREVAAAFEKDSGRGMIEAAFRRE